MWYNMWYRSQLGAYREGSGDIVQRGRIEEVNLPVWPGVDIRGLLGTASKYSITEANCTI